ncbi:MAG: isochorismatase family cysteine hydrolase [Spirochaetota bacterium]
MENPNTEKPAFLIIDMVKDNFIEARKLPITTLAKKIIDPINKFSAFFRKKGWPVIFSTDAFHKEDFIFKSSMTPHSLAGTKGAEVIDELELLEGDLWLPKPRFSAFFNTGLEKRLKEMGITLCAVGGISTQYCVLTTIMDAVCHDFKAVFIEDCTTAATEASHKQTLDLYRRNPLYPLFKVQTSIDFMKEFQ